MPESVFYLGPISSHEIKNQPSLPGAGRTLSERKSQYEGGKPATVTAGATQGVALAFREP